MNRKYSKVIKEIAKKHGVSPESVYYEMQVAIEAGFNNPDPAIQERWRKIAPDGKMPPPEKFIETMAEKIKKDIQEP